MQLVRRHTINRDVITHFYYVIINTYKSERQLNLKLGLRRVQNLVC